MKRAVLLLLVAFALPATATAQEEPPSAPASEESDFDPAHEWELKTWGPELKIGPIDMSLNKAVAYLILGMVVSIAIGILFMRVKVGKSRPAAGAGETIYEVAQVQVAEQACRRRRSGAGSRTSRR